MTLCVRVVNQLHNLNRFCYDSSTVLCAGQAWPGACWQMMQTTKQALSERLQLPNAQGMPFQSGPCKGSRELAGY